MSHNLSGFPDGIAGQDLLARMRAQAKRYGAKPAKGQVELLEKSEPGFVAVMVDGTRHSARRILLATGTEDVPPPLDLPDRKAAV